MDGSPPLPRRTSLSKRPRTASPSPPPVDRVSGSSSPSRAIDSKGKRRANPLEGFDPDDEDEVAAMKVKRRELAKRELSLVEQEQTQEEEEDDGSHCAICLSPIDNKAVVMSCQHSQFCFGCIRPWTDQSRRCPLCLGPITALLYNIRSETDYQTYHLQSLRAPLSSFPTTSSRAYRPPALPLHFFYGKPPHQSKEDQASLLEIKEERALERRKYIYKEKLFAKHIASNRYTRFKPVSCESFVKDPLLKARVLKFVRRELQVFPHVDSSFLTTYLLSIFAQLDLRSSSAIRLISDFLTEENAEHLIHEIYSFARSPYNDLESYDRVAQYGRPEGSKIPVDVKEKTGVNKRRFSESYPSDGRGPPDDGFMGRNGKRGRGRGRGGTDSHQNDDRWRASQPRSRRDSDQRRDNRSPSRSRSRSHERSSRQPRHRSISKSRSPPHIQVPSTPSPSSPRPPPSPKIPPSSNLLLAPRKDESDDDVISLCANEEDLNPPPIPSPSRSTTVPAKNAFSIFGAAKRLSGTKGTNKETVEVDRVETEVEPVDIAVPSESSEALKQKLQDRLMDEYRTAVNNRPSATSSSSSLLVTGQEAEEAERGPVRVIYSLETRRLLQQRLEEERNKSLEMKSSVLVDEEGSNREEKLRKSLMAGRTLKKEVQPDEVRKEETVQGDLDKRASELKERLLKMKLLKRK